MIQFSFVADLPFFASCPEWLKRLLTAMLAVVLGIALLKLGHILIRRIVGQVNKKKAEHSRSKITLVDDPATSKTMISLGQSIFDVVIYFFMVMAVLDASGVDVTSILAVAGVGGIALGFGCQTLVKDVISGLFLWVDGFVRVGEIVKIGTFTGTVESVSIRTTTLRGTNGDIMNIPNGDIRTVTNMTRDYRFAMVDITVAHGQDYYHAMEVLRQAMAEVDEKLLEIESSPEVVGIISSDGRAATIRIEIRCDIGDCWKVEREIRAAALECFRKEGIKP